MVGRASPPACGIIFVAADFSLRRTGGTPVPLGFYVGWALPTDSSNSIMFCDIYAHFSQTNPAHMRQMSQQLMEFTEN